MSARLRATAQFLALGALLLAARAWLVAPDARPRETITIPSERVAELRRGALARWGRLPDARELEALIQAEVADEILYREALARGVDRSDGVVRARLVRNMRFLDPDPGRDPGALLREARELGMERSDLVVRRRLVQRMRLAIESGARAREPDDAALEAHLAAQPGRFARPARVRLEQLYFDPARRADPEAAARARLARLARAPASGVASAADAFLVPRELPLQSRRELARHFGEDFAEAVFALPVARWSGPLRSAHGVHLVRVHERVPAALPPLGAVRAQVRDALLSERAERALRAAVDRARERYEIRIPEGGDGD